MQLELFARATPSLAATGRTPEQESAFQSLLSEARRQKAEVEAIGRQLFSDFVDLQNCPIERYKAVCEAWHRSQGQAPAQAVNLLPPKAKILPPIRQWSIDAKRKNRLKKLHQRLYRQFSIPGLFHNAIQEQVLRNPSYYGICPLPCEGGCIYYPPNLRQIAAIKLENEHRAREI